MRFENGAFEYDRVWVTPMSLRQNVNGSNEDKPNKGKFKKTVLRSRRNRIYGSIVEIKGGKVFFKFDESLDKFAAITGIQPQDERYFIRFMNNRTTTMLEHQALDMFEKDKAFQFVFPSWRETDLDGFDFRGFEEPVHFFEE